MPGLIRWMRKALGQQAASQQVTGQAPVMAVRSAGGCYPESGQLAPLLLCSAGQGKLSRLTEPPFLQGEIEKRRPDLQHCGLKLVGCVWWTHVASRDLRAPWG